MSRIVELPDIDPELAARIRWAALYAYRRWRRHGQTPMQAAQTVMNGSAVAVADALNAAGEFPAAALAHLLVRYGHAVTLPERVLDRRYRRNLASWGRTVRPDRVIGRPSGE